MLWLTSVRSVIRAVAIQGVALGTVALILGVDQRREQLEASGEVAGVDQFVLE